MGVSRLINTAMVTLALSIFLQLITFATPGWLCLHMPSGLFQTSGLEFTLKYSVWYIIACVKGRFQGHYIREFQCNTLSYHKLWKMMENEHEYGVNVFESMVPSNIKTELEEDKAKAQGYAAIVKWEIQITLALVAALVAFSLMRRQSLQFASVEMGDTTVPPSRNMYAAIVLFTVLSACLLLVPSVAFIQVNMAFKKLAELSRFKVGFPYCLVLSVFAAALNGIACLSVICLTCRRQGESIQYVEASGQNGNPGQQQALPLMSLQTPPQYPNKQPPQAYMYPNQQYPSSGGYQERLATNHSHQYSPNNQQGWYPQPPPEGQGNQPNTVQYGQDNVQYWPSDKHAPAQYQTKRSYDQSQWQPESHSDVQTRSHESQSHLHFQGEHGYRQDRAPQGKGDSHCSVSGAGNADHFQRALPDLPENDNAHYLAQEHQNEMGRWSNEEYGDPADNHDDAQLLMGSRSDRGDARVRDDVNAPPYWKQPPPI